MLYHSINLKQPRTEGEWWAKIKNTENIQHYTYPLLLRPFSRKMFSPGWNTTFSKHGLTMRGLKSLWFPLTF